MSDSFSTPKLPALGILEPLGDDDRDILSGYGEFLPANPDHPIIEEGMGQNGLYFVISGKLHATSTRAGRAARR